MVDLQQVVAHLEQLRIVININVASITILIFDYFLTLPSETSLIWSARWTCFKVLFLVTRYLPFVDAIIFSQC